MKRIEEVQQALIISHPYMGNYGGFLQAVALNLSCSSCGVLSRIVDYEIPETLGPNTRFMVQIKARIGDILYCLGLIRSYIPHSIVARFAKLHKKFFKTLYVRKQIINEAHNFVVGSDQVWRGEYARGLQSLPFFFLNFANNEQRKRSISYAASFGSDEWEGTPEETEVCGRLLREFKAVSVREHSGVKICKEVFGVFAVQMPDPTLLLHPIDYGKIIEMEKTWLPHGKYIATYVLDETRDKTSLLQKSAERLSLQLQHLMPHATAKKRRDRFPISLSQWLRLIRDCEYFITDSFHGCVFAIIFNKPFVCLGNEGRGNARFDTLLGTFGLEDRLISDATPEKVMQVLHTPIDWERVNAIHAAERERGINFLKENLCE